MLEVLDAWPVLPVILRSNNILPNGLRHPKSDQRWNNMVAALESEHYNRIREIRVFGMTNLRWDRFAASVQKPFPELTILDVGVKNDVVPVLPDSFLGGSAPRLRELTLRGFPLPSIPKLLLSANGLIALSLWSIPDSGISPDAMATVLTVMTRLESLELHFNSSRFRPDPASRPLPPPTRFVLPALTNLEFVGVHEYLEGLLARIDAPLLYYLNVEFFMALNFDIPQLHRLIGHAEKFKTFDHAQVWVEEDSISLHLSPPETWEEDYPKPLELGIACRDLDWQLSSLAQVCSSSFPLVSTVERLDIWEGGSPWTDDMENTQWLELLDPFTALKDLYLTDEIARHVCGALQELSGERAVEVLPVLRNLFVDGLVSIEHIEEAIRPFVAARQHSGHPVVVDHW